MKATQSVQKHKGISFICVFIAIGNQTFKEAIELWRLFYFRKYENRTTQPIERRGRQENGVEYEAVYLALHSAA